MTPPPLGRSLTLRFDGPALERDPSSIVLIDRHGTIRWANPAWYAFFEANGGGPDRAAVVEGASYLASVRGALGDFYRQVFATCLETGLPYEQDYECSSRTEVRSYRLRILPVDGELLVSHTLRSVGPRDGPGRSAPPVAEDLRRFVTADGMLLQCSNCRRLRRSDGSVWEWVPDAVLGPRDDVSHGLCHLCEGFYYGALGTER